MDTYKIAVIAGDGIGPEAMAECIKVLKTAAELDGKFAFDFTAFPWGCEYYLQTGQMMPDDGIEILRNYDAILLGAVGIPVFSGFRGGVGVLLGVTGGYIVGFLFTALTVGLAVKRFGRSFPVLILSMVLGILLCYAFGTAWFMIIYTRGGNAVTLGSALGMCVVPYLIPDGIKIVLAAVLVRRLWPAMSKELIPA